MCKKMNFKKIIAMGLMVSSVASASWVDVSAAYSVSTAIAYAKKYVYNHNLYYMYFEDANCTNFVSQCIFYGGISMRNVPKNANTLQATRVIVNDKNAWYYVSPDCYNYKTTQSWTTVNGFYQYWKEHDNGVCSSEYTIDQLAKVVQPGDVVQVRDKVKYRHTVLCRENSNAKNESDKSKIKFIYNSNDMHEKSLADFHVDFAENFELDNSTFRYRIIRFK